MGRNPVWCRMVSVLGCTRRKAMLAVAMMFVLTSSITWERDGSGFGMLVSAAGPGARLDAWTQDHDREAAAAAAAAAAADGLADTGEHGWQGDGETEGAPRNRQRPPAPSAARHSDGVDVEAGNGNVSDKDISMSMRPRQPRRRRRARRLDPEVGVGKAGGRGGVEYAANSEQAKQWGVPMEVMPKGLTAEETEEVSRQRDYLNGLVDDSAAKTREQACNVAFAKTHKTASTTMAMILVRYARRHDKKLAAFGGRYVSEIPLREAVAQIKESGERVDVMHYHYSTFGGFDGRWDEATQMYEEIMQEGERISYITVVRDQRSHFMSYYYYFVQPEVQLSVQHFFGSNRKDAGFQRQRKRLENPMCAEFGISTRDELQYFIDKQLPQFRLVLLTEEFDEGLMMLRRLMGWEMIDLTYSRMMETKAGGVRWDGKELKDVPHWQDLPDWVQDSIDANTELDKILYEAAANHYREMKAVAAAEIEADLQEFAELQHVVAEYLHKNSSSEAIRWYSGSAQPYKGGEAFAPF